MPCPDCEAYRQRIEELEAELDFDPQEIAPLLVAKASDRYLRPQDAYVMALLYRSRRPVSYLRILDETPGMAGARGDELERSRATLRTWIHRIRATFGHEVVRNHWGWGYELTPSGRAVVERIISA